MYCSRIQFESLKKAVFVTGEALPEVEADQLLIENDYSALSAGTELANYCGLPNTSGTFPYFPGYSSCGRVIRTGSAVKSFKTGDRVVSWGGHCSHHLKKESELVRIEDDAIDGREAAFARIATFSFLGVRRLNLRLGESVMVAGLGVLGLIALQLARCSGAYPVIAADYSPERRALALKLGADAVFSPGEKEFVEKVRSVTHGGVNAVVEVTGVAAALQQALEYVARLGRISLLGCTRIPDVPIDFYQSVHLRGVTLVGTHTLTRPRVESRPDAWTELDDYRTFLNFLSGKRLRIAPFLSEVVSPAEAGEVYASLAASNNPPVGIVFDWSKVRK